MDRSTYCRHAYFYSIEPLQLSPGMDLLCSPVHYFIQQATKAIICMRTHFWWGDFNFYVLLDDTRGRKIYGKQYSLWHRGFHSFFYVTGTVFRSSDAVF